MELICKVQNYHWGKRGSNSLVARLASANSGIDIDESKTYAELWMGTHPNAPSHLKNKNISLAQYLNEKPKDLGSEVLDSFGCQLPFLFKVLSVETALSVQAHPTKSHAEKLFKDFPDIYKDPNHKPELAIALTSFEALCGFRPQSQIKFFLKNVPELKEVIGEGKIQKFLKAEDNSEEAQDAFKSCFQSLMVCDELTVKNSLDNLLKRLNSLKDQQKSEFSADIIQRVHDQFPGDVGIFCIYFLNYLTLLPGEALYLAPNEPHAYLSGDCVECMSNSDNVVRAGLTPKLRDIKTLCQMLTYKHYEKNEICFKPVIEDEYTQTFKPPINEFAVAKIVLPSGSNYHLIKRKSASVLLVMEGQGVFNSDIPIKAGSILFVPASKECSLAVSENVVIFQAFCNI